MKPGLVVSVILIVGVILLALWAFQRQEGPAERAGRQLDDATAKAGQQIERAGEKIQDAAKRAKQ